MPETHAKLEPHEHVAVPLLQRHPRPRLRVRERTTKDKHVHQDLRIWRCVVLASGDVSEAVRSGTAWRVTRWLQRLSARHACPHGTPVRKAPLPYLQGRAKRTVLGRPKHSSQIFSLFSDAAWH